MIYIGIDTGLHTGFAVWHSDTKYLAEVDTMSITQAMERIDEIASLEMELRSSFFGPDKIPALQLPAARNTRRSVMSCVMSSGRTPRGVCSTMTRRQAV